MLTLTDQQVLDKVRDVLAEEIGLPRERVVPEATLLADLELDSLDALELLAALEDEIGSPLGDDLEKLRTVGDVVAAVRANLPQAGTGATVSGAALHPRS